MIRRGGRRLDPIDRDIIRTLTTVRLRVTPTKIARAIYVHPSTVKKRIIRLSALGITDCKKRGNRTMCRLNPRGLKAI